MAAAKGFGMDVRKEGESNTWRHKEVD